MGPRMKISNIHKYWQSLEKYPLGRWLFNQIISFINPYTGSLRASIIEFEKGYAKLRLRDRRGIRNHLNSIHAIALTNLGEFTSGLALISLLADDCKAIPIEIKIEFLKKARGTLMAECHSQMPELNAQKDRQTIHTVQAIIKDSDQDVVATVNVIWTLTKI